MNLQSAQISTVKQVLVGSTDLLMEPGSINPSPRFLDYRPVAKVLLQILVVGKKQPRPADPGQSQHMGIVGFADTAGFQIGGFGGHRIVGKPV